MASLLAHADPVYVETEGSPRVGTRRSLNKRGVNVAGDDAPQIECFERNLVQLAIGDHGHVAMREG